MPGIVVALAAAFALVGCFGLPGGSDAGVGSGGSEAAEEGAEELVEGMTGGDSDIEMGGELPDNFPASVPLIEATIDSAMYMDVEDEAQGDATKGWIVSMTVEDPTAAAQDARQLLLDAGFTETLWNDPAGMVTGMFENDDFGVSLSVLSDSGTVGYTVIPRATEQ